MLQMVNVTISLGPKRRKSSFLSLENPWKLVESHFMTAPNVKKVCETILVGEENLNSKV